MRAMPFNATCEAEVQAPIEAVWRVAADVTRTGEWSHECRTAEWLAGATSAVPGARFRGRNQSMWWHWARVNEVVDVQPRRLLSWRTLPSRLFVDSTTWQITLEPLPAGTRIRQTYTVVRCPAWWRWLMAYANPPHRDRSAALTADLHRLGAIAARDADAKSVSS